jgi:hypothetical protein
VDRFFKTFSVLIVLVGFFLAWNLGKADLTAREDSELILLFSEPISSSIIFELLIDETLLE